MSLSRLALMIVFAFVEPVLAVPSPLVVKPDQVSSPFSTGSSVGGRSADEFSLLGVKTEVVTENAERVVLLFGDRHGKPLKGEPGYFNVALEQSGRRIVIDLAQVQKTAVDPARLATILKGSKAVASSEMTMDPLDHSTDITLETRMPVRLRVGSVTGEPAKLFIEISPNAGAAK